MRSMIDLFKSCYRTFAAQPMQKIIHIGIEAEVCSRIDAEDYDEISKKAVTAPEVVINVRMGCRSVPLVQKSGYNEGCLATARCSSKYLMVGG